MYIVRVCRVTRPDLFESLGLVRGPRAKASIGLHRHKLRTESADGAKRQELLWTLMATWFDDTGGGRKLFPKLHG